jgi:sugar/nucleoside kinase (ribokinase family)
MHTMDKINVKNLLQPKKRMNAVHRPLIVGQIGRDVYVHSVSTNNKEKSKSKIESHYGGGGANLAVGLAKLSIYPMYYPPYQLGAVDSSATALSYLHRKGVTPIGATEEAPDIAISRSVIFLKQADLAGTRREVYADPTQACAVFDHNHIHEYRDNLGRLLSPSILIASSLGEGWEDTYTAITAYKKRNKIPLIFAPGSQQIHSYKSKIFKEMYDSADIVAMNISEGAYILDYGPGEKSIETIIRGLQARGKGPKLLFLTDDVRGAFAAFGESRYGILPFTHSVAPYRGSTVDLKRPESEPKDGTGAGDNFLAAAITALLFDGTIELALKCGAINGRATTELIGAQNGLNYIELQRILDAFPRYTAMQIPPDDLLSTYSAKGDIRRPHAVLLSQVT